MKNPLKMIPYWYLLLLPIFFSLFGSFLNIFVIALNHNQMPVLAHGSCDPNRFATDIIHTCMTADTHIKFLSDWIYTGDGTASIGDMFIYLGDFLFLPALYIWAAFIVKDHNSLDKSR